MGLNGQYDIIRAKPLSDPMLTKVTDIKKLKHTK